MNSDLQNLWSDVTLVAKREYYNQENLIINYDILQRALYKKLN